MVLKIARVTPSVAAGLVCAACSSSTGGTFVPLGSGPGATAPNTQAVVDASAASDGREGATQGAPPSSVDAATTLDGSSGLAGPYALRVKFRKIIDLNGGALGSFNALASIDSTAQLTVDPATQAATLSTSECHMDITGTGTGGLQGATLQIADIIMTTTHVAPATLTAGGGSLAWNLSELQAPVGWHWSSPSDTTPTSASDPRVFDQDNDGMPGVTMHVLWNGTDTAMPYVQKQREMLGGTGAPGGALAGTSVDSDEINIIGNTSALSGAKVTWVDDPNTADNTVRLVPVPSALSCAQLMAETTKLFP